MMPPTGLTLIVHGLIILGNKSAKVLHLSLPKSDKQKDLGGTHTGISAFIILIITAYIFGTVGLFMHRALFDSRATWKMAQETWGHIPIAAFRLNTLESVLVPSKPKHNFTLLHFSESPPGQEINIGDLLNAPTINIPNYPDIIEDPGLPPAYIQKPNSGIMQSNRLTYLETNTH